MRIFCLLILVISACAPGKEGATAIDSVAIPGYEDFSEVTSFAVKDDLSDQAFELFGRQENLSELLRKLYSPDTLVSVSPDDTLNTPGYIITDALLLDGNLFVKDGQCSRRVFLMTLRGDFVDQEYYDLLVIGRDSNGQPILRDKIVFEGSEGQSTTIVSVSLEKLSSNAECFVLKVTSASEGGDINLHKDQWAEYFIADERSLRPILKVALEETDIEAYEASKDDTQNTSAKRRRINVLKTSTNGLYDIEVSFENRQNGNVVATALEKFSFDGNQYVSK